MELSDRQPAHYKARNSEQISPCPYPKVNWTQLRLNLKRNLPLPTEYPILSCPQDPGPYPDSPSSKGRTMKMIKEEKFNGGPERQETSIHEDRLKKITLTTHRINSHTNAKEEELLRKVYLPVNTYAPFGTLPGFHRSQGIITPPIDLIGGYILEGSQWILYTAPNQDRYY